MKDCDEGNDVYMCEVWNAAEGFRKGYVYLTKEQYETVKYVSDVNNWNDVSDEGWSGSFGIYCEMLE